MSTAQPNHDPSEIARFEAIASRWWDSDSEFAPLHAINPLRLEFIQQFCPNLTDKKIADIGCGGGILSESLAIKGAHVTAIDLGKKPLEVAHLHQLETEAESGTPLNLAYRQISAEDLATEQTEQFDIVTCMEMLEHVPDPDAIIKSCAQLTKPGGFVFFSTINRNPKAFLFAIFGAEYLLNLLPKGTHQYRRFIKPSELAHSIRDAGLNLKKMGGLGYNPLTKHYFSTPNTHVNYLLACHK